MNAVAKALWFIESHLSENPSLEEIAEIAGVSPFHLTRAFALTTGSSVMRYARGRRLTEAARSLARGAPNILDVALGAGYGSHEAFSRAFRDQFGVTPESVRGQGHEGNLNPREAIKMNPDSNLDANVRLKPIRFEDGKPMKFAGLSRRYACDNNAGIPGQWQVFGPYLGHILGQAGPDAYGVCSNFDDEGNYDYLCAVEVNSFDGLPSEFAHLPVAQQRYAVFGHRDHVASIMMTWKAIWNWTSVSGFDPVPAPQFEKYTENFDPRTGLGGFEIWIPVRKKSQE